jgi:Carboxypeptidase regulatory-like domain
MFLRMDTIKPNLQNRHARACGPLHLVKTRVLTQCGSVAKSGCTINAVLRTAFFYAFATSLAAFPLAAQISLATLSGTVKDSTGAVIPSATVKALNLATNFTRTAKTGPQGEYVIADLPVEHYMVKVSFTGFKTGVLPDLELQVGQHELTMPCSSGAGHIEAVFLGRQAFVARTPVSAASRLISTLVSTLRNANHRIFLDRFGNCVSQVG